VQVRQVEVEQDDVDGLLAQEPQRRPAVVHDAGHREPGVRWT
jgi:hypothetical protein